MNLEERLRDSVNRWTLLNHPFYQAWESGALPVEALKTYAREYGAFIKLMPNGWETLNDLETAEEERRHADLWQDFALALDTKVGDANLPAVADLVSMTSALFSNSKTALGALYAFEVQQPATAKSKLEGLRKHYALPENAETYFLAHANNDHEADKLLGLISSLPESELEQVVRACGQMSEALWNALTDVYQTHCAV